MKHTRRRFLTDADHMILTRIAQFDSNEPRPVADLSDDELTAEFARVRDRGTELSGITDRALTADESTELGTLAGRLTEVQTEQGARADAAAQLQAHRDAFATLPPVEPVVSTPPAPPTPGPGPDTPPVAPAEPAPIVASVPAVPSVAAVPAAPQTPPVPQGRGEFQITLTADGAGALKRSYNDDSQVTVKDVTKAVLASFKAYGSAGTGGGQSAKRAIAQFTRERPEDSRFELTMASGSEGDYSTVKELVREGRLSGGSLLSAWRSNIDKGASLTAAAGWCAPSENLYDLCSLWSMDGILDLPTATARRGGFNYVQSQPTWAALDAATNFTILTEAQVIADTAKNCAEIPCPTFTDTRLDVAVTCITGSFLQSAGYPEMVETWVDGTLTNHAHKLNENIIGRITTFAGAATVIPAQGDLTGTGATGLGNDSSVTTSVLWAVDLAATDMRYRDRMSFNQTFEVILPMWVLTAMRADISRKNGWSMVNAALADAQIVSWFAARNIRPQFVYDYQDFYAGGTGPGNPAAVATALPSTVNFLIFPAGAVVLARQDVVTLSNVYDSANLQQNLYTRLFTEEGFNLLFPCGPVRQYTAQACPSGATAFQAYTNCAAPDTGGA